MNNYISLIVITIMLVFNPFCCFAEQKNIFVTNSAELKHELKQVQSGTTIFIAPGVYERGIFLKNVHGTAEAPIVITGSDPSKPPVIMGKGEGAKLSRCSYIRLSCLTFQQLPGNGINIDDGGTVETPSHHILLENIRIEDIGPKGNNDALKMSGVDHFIVRNCYFEGWGGSGIDMVGCHHGVIEGCQFLGKDGFRTANGVQIKGGSRFVLLQTSFFRNAGERIINLGGMTGLKYFRPLETDYEARDIILAGNTFIGGEAHVAWVTAQDSHVHHNLFFRPGKWVGRIQQETKDPRFKPSGRGFFESNMAVTDERVGMVVFNVSRGTDPDSFVFRGNAWFRPDSDRKPALPVREEEGIYDMDPMILDFGNGPLKANSADPRLRQVGPWDYTPWRAGEDFADIRVPSVVLPEK